MTTITIEHDDFDRLLMIFKRCKDNAQVIQLKKLSEWTKEHNQKKIFRFFPVPQVALPTDQTTLADWLENEQHNMGGSLYSDFMRYLMLTDKIFAIIDGFQQAMADDRKLTPVYFSIELQHYYDILRFSKEDIL